VVPISFTGFCVFHIFVIIKFGIFILCGYETRSLAPTSGEEHRLRFFEERMLKRLSILAQGRGNSERLAKLQNEKLYNLYSPLKLIV
jgi:hypothetical protein